MWGKVSCLRKQETLPQMLILEVTLRWASIPYRGGIVMLLVASRKLRSCGTRLVKTFLFLLFRLPIVQGGSFAFFAPIFAILALPQWKCPKPEGQFSYSQTSIR